MSYKGNEVGLNHRVMRLNEDIEKMLYYARSSKAARMLSESRSTKSLDRASSRAGRASNIMYTVDSCSPLDQAARSSEPLLWSSEPSNVLKMLFLTLQVLGAVSLLLIHSFNVLNVT